MKIEHLATLFFAMAMLHSFSVSFVAAQASKFRDRPFIHFALHLLSEVEIVFGFWALLFLAAWGLLERISAPLEFHRTLNLTEPVFVFCIMLVASTGPIINFATKLIFSMSSAAAKVFRCELIAAQFVTLMFLGPLMGSLITEPAAITITAVLLYKMLNGVSEKFLYVVLAYLFVNVSIGGALTPFAAPPILMVARGWNWELSDVFLNLGVPAIAAVFINSLLLVTLNKKNLRNLNPIEKVPQKDKPWLTLIHLVTLVGLVVYSHHIEIFFPVTVIFIIFVIFTEKFQSKLKFKEALLVSFFLYGLVVFGKLQGWWLSSLIERLHARSLYFAAVILTSFTDNAALTYLGSQVENLNELSKWSLTAGALVGGGLTIVANAPNAAGFAVLSQKFSEESLNGLFLFKAAIVPTTVAMCCYYGYLLV